MFSTQERQERKLFKKGRCVLIFTGQDQWLQDNNFSPKVFNLELGNK